MARSNIIWKHTQKRDSTNRAITTNDANTISNSIQTSNIDITYERHIESIWHHLKHLHWSVSKCKCHHINALEVACRYNYPIGCFIANANCYLSFKQNIDTMHCKDRTKAQPCIPPSDNSKFSNEQQWVKKRMRNTCATMMNGDNSKQMLKLVTK